MTEENTPLISSPENEIQISDQRNKTKRLILGGLSGLLSSFIFACYNMEVKKYKLDFLDVLVFRATSQVIIFGLLGYFFGHRFWPLRNSQEDSKKYYIKCFKEFPPL